MTPSTEELLASFGNKPLPMDYDSEQSVISCLIQRPQLCDELPPAEFFHHPVSKMVYAGVLAVIASKLPLDCVTLTRVLREANVLDKCGGAYYLTTLLMGGEASAMAGHYSHYLSIISEKFRMRQMIGALAAGIAHLQAFTEVDGVSATGALEHCQKLVCEAVNDDGSSDLPFRSIGEIMTAVVDGIEYRQAHPGVIPGISTGFAGFDKYLGGMESGRLTVIAGESSDGKSILARMFVESACMNDHVGVLYSYEMRDEEEGGRILCNQAGIDSSKIKHGLMNRAEQESLGAKMGRIIKWPISIVDAAGKTIEQICRDIARRSKKLKNGQKLVASIDYIQLCLTANKNSNREREVAHITATAKQCAKLTGAHIIMPSQLNEDGKVRESRAIEQDADNLIIIQKPKPKDDGKKAWQKKAEDDEPNYERNLFIKKNRNGERLKIVKATLLGHFFRFQQAAQDSDPN